MGQSAEHRARPSVSDHGVTPRQEFVLGDVAADDHTRRLRPEHSRVVLPTDGDDEIDVIVKCLDHQAEDVQVGVPDRPQRDVHGGPMRKVIEPRRTLRDMRFAGGGSHRLHSGDVGDLWVLQCRGTRVDVEVSEGNPASGCGFESAASPVRSGSGTRLLEQCSRDQRAVSDVDVGDVPAPYSPTARRARPSRARPGLVSTPT